MPGKFLAQLQEITVRPDWEAAEVQARSLAARRRVLFEVVLLAYGAITIVLTTWTGDHAWTVLLQWLLFAATLLVLPFWIALAEDPNRPRIILPIALAVTAAVALGVLTTPAAYRATPIRDLPGLDPRLGLVIPLIMAGLLGWTGVRYPEVKRALSLEEPRWGRELATGFALGAALGLHLTSTLLFLPGGAPGRLPGLANLAWLVGVSAGLFAVGQEICLRGLLFTFFGPRPSIGPIPALAVIMLLNLLLYVAPASNASLTPALVACLAYEVVFALLATTLRARSGSVIASMAANAAFGVFLLMAFLR